jgi:hypothetical protein
MSLAYLLARLCDWPVLRQKSRRLGPGREERSFLGLPIAGPINVVPSPDGWFLPWAIAYPVSAGQPGISNDCYGLAKAERRASNLADTGFGFASTWMARRPVRVSASQHASKQ